MRPETRRALHLWVSRREHAWRAYLAARDSTGVSSPQSEAARGRWAWYTVERGRITGPDDSPAIVGWAREAGLAGYRNRTQRRQELRANSLTHCV